MAVVVPPEMSEDEMALAIIEERLDEPVEEWDLDSEDE